MRVFAGTDEHKKKCIWTCMSNVSSFSCMACGVDTDRSWRWQGRFVPENFLHRLRQVVNIPHNCRVTVSVAMHRERFRIPRTLTPWPSPHAHAARVARPRCRCSRWQPPVQPAPGQPSVLLGRLRKTHGEGLATETFQDVRDGAGVLLAVTRASSGALREHATPLHIGMERSVPARRRFFS